MKLTKSDYVLKLSNATPLQLVIINYELIISCIDDALSDESGEYFGFVASAKAFLDELIAGLDMSYDISRQLFPIYVYVSKLLLEASQKRRASSLEECKKIMEHLMGAWKQLDKYDNKPPQTENTVYAGLTYGKDGRLNEYIDSTSGRGYKA